MDRTLPYEECLLNAKEKEAQRRARLQADRSRPATKVGCCFPLPLRHTLRSPTTSPPAPEQTEQKGRDPPGPPDGEPGHRARRPGSQRRRCVVLFNPLNPQLLTKTNTTTTQSRRHYGKTSARLRRRSTTCATPSAGAATTTTTTTTEPPPPQQQSSAWWMMRNVLVY